MITSNLFIFVRRKKGKKSKQPKASTSATNGHSQNGSGDSELSRKLCEQSKLLWKMIDTLKKLDLKKAELMSILSFNEQEIPTGIDKVKFDILLYWNITAI